MRNFSNLTYGANLYAFYDINDEYASVPTGEDKMQILKHLAHLFETSLDAVICEYRNISLQISENEEMKVEDYIVEWLNPSEARAIFNLALFFKKVDQDSFGVRSRLNSSLVFNYSNFNTGCSLVVSYTRY